MTKCPKGQNAQKTLCLKRQNAQRDKIPKGKNAQSRQLLNSADLGLELMTKKILKFLHSAEPWTSADTKNLTQRSNLALALSVLCNIKGSLDAIHEWRYPFGRSFPLSRWKKKMGDVVHGWLPDYLFYSIKKGSLGVVHEWRHPFGRSFPLSGRKKKWVTSTIST